MSRCRCFFSHGESGTGGLPFLRCFLSASTGDVFAGFEVEVDAVVFFRFGVEAGRFEAAEFTAVRVLAAAFFGIINNGFRS